MGWIIIILFLGTFFWLSNLGVLSFTRDWPLILVFLGMYNLGKAIKKGRKGRIIADLASGKISACEAEEKLKKVL